MPYDPHLADRMRAALARRRSISERAMFGGFCWMLNGNMLCGVEVGRFMFRVGKELSTRRPAEAARSQAGSNSPRVSSVRYRRDSERTLCGGTIVMHQTRWFAASSGTSAGDEQAMGSRVWKGNTSAQLASSYRTSIASVA